MGLYFDATQAFLEVCGLGAYARMRENSILDRNKEEARLRFLVGNEKIVYDLLNKVDGFRFTGWSNATKSGEPEKSSYLSIKVDLESPLTEDDKKAGELIAYMLRYIADVNPNVSFWTLLGASFKEPEEIKSEDNKSNRYEIAVWGGTYGYAMGRGVTVLDFNRESGLADLQERISKDWNRPSEYALEFLRFFDSLRQEASLQKKYQAIVTTSPVSVRSLT